MTRQIQTIRLYTIDILAGVKDMKQILHRKHTQSATYMYTKWDILEGVQTCSASIQHVECYKPAAYLHDIFISTLSPRGKEPPPTHPTDDLGQDPGSNCQDCTYCIIVLHLVVKHNHKRCRLYGLQ